MLKELKLLKMLKRKLKKRKKIVSGYVAQSVTACSGRVSSNLDEQIFDTFLDRTCNMIAEITCIINMLIYRYGMETVNRSLR